MYQPADAQQTNPAKWNVFPKISKNGVRAWVDETKVPSGNNFIGKFFELERNKKP